jgi:hypothetical protein
MGEYRRDVPRVCTKVGKKGFFSGYKALLCNASREAEPPLLHSQPQAGNDESNLNFELLKVKVELKRLKSLLPI